ncbi:MAG: hypothetical protein LQ343_005158 [Gyalolechia ehrenbergii]|nr:MAG: hypothetical protein LQ343_005158 [Gyalolechia ehrenbergii]
MANMNNLTTLIKRLEAATSRLEDMMPTGSDPSVARNGLASLPESGLTAPRADVEDEPSSSQTQLAVAPLPPAIDDFDALINGDVKTFVNMSEEIGGLVAEQSAAVLRAFAAERKFLIVTTKAKKPDIQSPVYMEVLKDLQSTMGIVNDIREANRPSPLFGHLTTVSEGINVLTWVAIETKPVDTITESLSSAQFWGNRVIKEYKEKDQTHVQWVQTFYRIFTSLSGYVKQHYPSGLTWNPDGVDPLQANEEVNNGDQSSTRSLPPQPSAGGPPPPPPLPNFSNAPPPPPMPPNGVPSSRSPSDMGAVFDEISRGEAVTSKLRRVDPSSQTHKNPSLRAGSAVPAGPVRSDSSSSRGNRSPIPGTKPKPESMRAKKPPKKELEGNKWLIENYDSNPPSGMLEIKAHISHSILISRCTKTTIRVIGKANAISLDNCTRVWLIIDSLVSAVDVIKSPRFELQVLGKLPTIMLDQVDGAAVYLGRESLGTEVFTSKCTGVNVNLPPPGDEEGDYVERALPEQMKHVVRDGVMVSEIVEHAG